MKASTFKFHGIPASVGADVVHADRQMDERTDMTKAGGTVRQYAGAFRKTGTVKWSTTVLLFCHVNAVVTSNSNYQHSASTCVGKRQGFPSFVCRTAGYKSVCIRKVLRPTDRPTHQLGTGFLASSVLQAKCRDGAQASKLLLYDFCAAFAI